jgi:hypothetical protein
VEPSSLRVLVNGESVLVRTRGVSRNLLVEADLPRVPEPLVNVRIEATDQASPPNVMVPFRYSFFTSNGEALFLRGDANADGSIDLGDPIFILFHLFLSGQEPRCEKASDTDGNDQMDISDVVNLLSYLFLGGSPPPDPFGNCGYDQPGHGLTCLTYPPCQ